jgi:hypothetical protein
MRSQFILIETFFVIGAVWLYAIHPTRIEIVPKLGPAPIIERAARFTFPEIKSLAETDADDVTKISGEHRELSLREVSSVGKASAKPIIEAHGTPHVETSKSEVQTH